MSMQFKDSSKSKYNQLITEEEKNKRPTSVSRKQCNS